MFIHFMNLRSFVKQQELSQLDEKACNEINVKYYIPSFRKKMFCVITFSVDENIGTCTDYCGTQPNVFLNCTKGALSE